MIIRQLRAIENASAIDQGNCRAKAEIRAVSRAVCDGWRCLFHARRSASGRGPIRISLVLSAVSELADRALGDLDGPLASRRSGCQILFSTAEVSRRATGPRPPFSKCIYPCCHAVYIPMAVKQQIG